MLEVWIRGNAREAHLLIPTELVVLQVTVPNGLVSTLQAINSVGISLLTDLDGSVFNLIEQAETPVQIHPNAMAYWNLVQQERMTATQHVRDTMLGHRSIEVIGQGGESLKQHRLRPINKSAQVNTPFKQLN